MTIIGMAILLLAAMLKPDAPNIFDPAGIASASVHNAVVSCVDSMKEGVFAKATDPFKVKYCSCYLDLMLNGEKMPLAESELSADFQAKVKTCLEYAQRTKDTLSPTEGPFRIKCDTDLQQTDMNKKIVAGKCNAEQITMIVVACRQALKAGEKDELETAFYCGCVTDAMLAKKHTENTPVACKTYAAQQVRLLKESQ